MEENYVYHYKCMGHYNFSVRITVQFLMPLVVCMLILYVFGGTSSLKSISDDRFFKDLSWKFYLLLDFFAKISFIAMYTESNGRKIEKPLQYHNCNVPEIVRYIPDILGRAITSRRGYGCVFVFDIMLSLQNNIQNFAKLRNLNIQTKSLAFVVIQRKEFLIK